MALGGVPNGLNENVPSVTSQAGMGYLDIQSIKTSFQQALDNEHIFPASGGLAGAHRQGSAVAFVGPASQLSSSDTEGRFYLDTTNSRLHHAGSSNTQLLGGRYAVESAHTMAVYYGNIASRITQCMAIEAGSFTLPTGSTGTNIVLQQTYLVAVVTSGVYPSPGIGGFPALLVSGNNLTMFNMSFTSAGIGPAAPATSGYAVNYMVMGIKAL